MKYEKITDDGNLWSVIFEGKEFNALDDVFEQWENPIWLREFFVANMADLSSYFKITDINVAIYDTIDDSEALQCLILDLPSDFSLDEIFRPLENNRIQEMLLGREKAKLRNRRNHPSWLRIYAIKLEPGIYIVTGGAIKLTATMAERQHTLDELTKIELVRNDLLTNGVVDADGFADYLQNK